MRGFLMVVCMLLSLGMAEATTWYVGTSGSDNNSCDTARSSTAADRKASIGAALGCVGLGDGAGANDTVVVGNGTYNEMFNNNLPGGSSWSSPFRLRAENRRQVTIRRTGTTTDHLFKIFRGTSKYAIISGFILDGQTRNGYAVKTDQSTTANYVRWDDMEVKNFGSSGIGISRTTNGWEVLNSYIHNNGKTDLDHGIYMSGHYVLIRGNTLANNFGNGMQVYASGAQPSFNTVRDNIVYGNGSTGLTIGGKENEVFGNIIYGNWQGMQLNYSGCTNNQIFNNSIYNNDGGGGYGIKVGTSSATCPNATIKNNIVLSHSNNIADINSSPGFLSASNQTSGTVASTWANAAGNDFRLCTANGAPTASCTGAAAAINSGTNTICSTTDVNNGRCNDARNVTDVITIAGGTPDKGALESGSVPAITTELVAELLLNNNVTDTSEYAKTVTNTGVTFTATDPLEGTHSAVFDANTDKLSVPTTGMSPTSGTISLVFTSADLTAEQDWLIGHTSSPEWANRIQLYKTVGGSLSVGMGNTSGLMSALYSVVLNTETHAALTWDGSQVCLWVNAVNRGCGSYSGLTTFGSALDIGNSGGSTASGWNGKIDRVKILNIVWTEAQIDAECDALITGGCNTATEPVYVDADLQNDIVNDTNGTTLTGSAHPTGPVDPGVLCQMSDGAAVNLTAAYNTGTQPRVIGCALAADGYTMTLTVDVPPPSAAATITLQYKAETPVSVTNNFTPPIYTNTNKTQDYYLCRRGAGNTDYSGLMGRVNEPCKDVNVTSPGQVNVLIGVTNSTGSTVVSYQTSLECKLNAGGTYARVGSEFGDNSVRFFQSDAALPDKTVITDETRALLPVPGGKTFVRRTIRRSDTEDAPDMANNGYKIDEWSLEVKSGIPMDGTSTVFCRDITPDGTALGSYGAADVAIAQIPIQAPRRIYR